MKYIRDKVWEMVAELLPDELVEKVLPVRYEGIKKWEDEIKDIVDSIESLAMSIENAEMERYEYESQRKRGENRC